MVKLLLIVLTIGLFGCTGVMKNSEGGRFTHDEIKSIKAGSSTVEDVLALLGEPQEKKESGAMVQYIYTYTVKKTHTYMGGLIARKSGAKTTTRRVEILIDNGTVYSYKFREEAEQ